MLEIDGLALTGLEISGSLLMVACLGLTHRWAAFVRVVVLNNGQRLSSCRPESMQRHQFCVATLCPGIALRDSWTEYFLARLRTVLIGLACGAASQLRAHELERLSRVRHNISQRISLQRRSIC